jgi:Flp pilus assembly protein TadG
VKNGDRAGRPVGVEPGRPAGDGGTIAIEMTFFIPAILLLFGLIFAYGRVAQVNGTLESGTRDAARSATVARSYDQALDAARRVVAEAVSPTPACLSSLDIQLLGTYEPGEPITVRVTCTYSLSDIGLPGSPGTLSPTTQFTSMLDPNRGIDP